jgi:hypothetical protein
LLQDVRDLARDYTQEAIETFVLIMRNHKAPSATRLAAASALLDRAWGKPAQQIETVTGKLSHEDWIKKLDAEDAELRARAAKLGIIDEQH